jgi:hypothetical protein
MPITNFYDEYSLSGLGKELAVDIEAEVEYHAEEGYAPTLYDPGSPGRIEVTGCTPTSIRIHPLEIPESKDSLIFIRLMNFFDPRHDSQVISPEDLDPQRRSFVEYYCSDHANDSHVLDDVEKYIEGMLPYEDD